MKYGFRTPNVKKRISARTTGRLKRSTKKVIPGYGAKGMGMVNDPSKAINNKIYHTTTTGIDDIPTTTTGGSDDGFGCLGCLTFIYAIGLMLFSAVGLLIVGTILWVVLQAIFSAHK